jgi:heme oxygenase
MIPKAAVKEPAHTIQLPAIDVMIRLRTETAAAHARLEQALDLLARPISRGRFTVFLERLYGFQRVWEPAVAPFFERSFFEPRRKTAILADDLIRLGYDSADPMPLRCRAAMEFGRTYERALGSLYVIEGATLDGKVIARALAGEEWAQDLRSFDPYGDGTKRMWAELKQVIAARSSPRTDAMIIAGAMATMDTLYDWLRPAFRTAS